MRKNQVLEKAIHGIFLLLGLITAGASAWRFWKKYQVSAARKSRADDPEDRPVVYFRHE